MHVYEYMYECVCMPCWYCVLVCVCHALAAFDEHLFCLFQPCHLHVYDQNVCMCMSISHTA